MRPVTSLDTFIGATKNFSPDGLYSNEIFGVVGTTARSSRFSYVDLRVPIIHPTIYKTLIQLKSFYKDIMSSKEFAKWDPQLKDFVKSDIVEGRTGYQFFMEHLQELVIPSNASVTRQQAVALFDKYRNRCTMSYVIVIPAGLRDIEIDDTGRTTSDAINELYYKLIAISNTINAASAKVSLESYNTQRVSFQNTVNEIYESFSLIIEGKKNLMMGKWASRRVFNGTRNVITAMNTAVEEFGRPENVGFNDTMIGLYQTVKALLPVTIHQLRKGFLDRCFAGVGAPVILTDPQTLQSVTAQLKATTYSDWLSNEGLEKLLTYFKEESIRHEPIMVEGKYLGLTYRGPDGTFALINGVEQLPEGRLAEHCTPITMTELLYCAIYDVANTFPCFVTRYPITGIGSVYPSMIKLCTTVHAEARKPLNTETWQVDSEKPIAYQFPVLGSGFYNSMSPHSSRLGRLGADFDGDTCSANIVYSDEARREVQNFFNSKRAYVGTDGRFINDTNVDTIAHVLRNVTGRRSYDLPKHKENRMVQGNKSTTNLNNQNSTVKQETKEPVYSEGADSLLTHNGATYQLDKLFELTRDLPVVRFPLDKLKWNVDSGTPDPDRVDKADPSVPILVTHENGRDIILDGLHRSTKALRAGETSIPTRIVPADLLAQAKQG